MEMNIEVTISLDGKRIIGNVTVNQQEWSSNPVHEVLKALEKRYQLELSRFYDNRKVEVDYGETIGRFDMDMTETLDEDVLAPETGWMDFAIQETVDEDAKEQLYFMQILNSLKKFFPALAEYEGVCKVCYPHEEDWNYDTLDGLIIHLNDNHEWTINEIADWLETLDADIQVAA